MMAKRPEKGGRRGGGKRTAPPRDQRRSDAGQDRNAPGAGTPGSSRLLLTRLVRDGAIWNVYVATTARAGAPNVTELEFVSSAPGNKQFRYSRPVEGAILESLHTGAPVSRASLEEALDLALQQVQ